MGCLEIMDALGGGGVQVEGGLLSTNTVPRRCAMSNTGNLYHIILVCFSDILLQSRKCRRWAGQRIGETRVAVQGPPHQKVQVGLFYGTKWICTYCCRHVNIQSILLHAKSLVDAIYSIYQRCDDRTGLDCISLTVILKINTIIAAKE